MNYSSCDKRSDKSSWTEFNGFFVFTFRLRNHLNCDGGGALNLTQFVLTLTFASYVQRFLQPVKKIPLLENPNVFMTVIQFTRD